MALTKVRRGGTDTGISDSSDATAITIDSSENITTSNAGIITAGRFINGTSSNDPWLKGVNSSGTETFFVKPDGRVNIGSSTASKMFHTYVNNSRSAYNDGWLARFHNDGNAVNLYGIEVFVGRDDGQYDNYAMRFCDGDGTEAGYISFNSGTVTYGTFTAHHP